MRIFILFLSFSLLTPPSHSTGSSSTLSISPSSTTVCAILALRSPLTIRCAQLSPKNPPSFPIFPSVSFRSLSAAPSFFCALRSDALSFLCWPSLSPSPKRVYSGPAPLSDLSLGRTQIAASNGSAIRFWRGASRFPLAIPGAFRSLTSGDGFTCAIRSEDRAVSCWGGAGGDGIQRGFANETMSTIVAGDSHACGENTAGVVVCRGSNSSGQLAVPVGPPAFELVGLALGGQHTCAIERTNNTVVCWGGNFTGGYYTPLGNTSVELLVAGGNLTCGVTTVNLSVLCWVAAPDPVSISVTVVSLPKVLPGICIGEEEESISCSCGIVPDSETLCAGSGVICKTTCPLLSPPSPSPPLPLPLPPPSSNKTSKWLSAFAIVGGVGTLMGVCTVIFCIWYGVCRQKKVYNSVQPTITTAAGNGNSGNSASPRISASGSKLRIFRRQGSRLAVMSRQRSGPSTSLRDRAEHFAFSELCTATNNFSSENKIGSGSFGTVYKGKLPDGREVAIKRKETNPKAKKLDEKESAFQSELAFLSRLHHKHLVGLVGYCEENEERLLVYDYMKNGALYDHLHSNILQSSPLLNSWKMRFKVLLDASRGIEYLHTYAVPPIIHRDIKSSNILLDSNWVARVSDFGLSLMGPEIEGDHLSMKAAGTVGYMDPEYYGLHHLTVKSDVYGFGVVMLEVLTGRKAIFKNEDFDGSGSPSPVSVVDYSMARISEGDIGRVLDTRVGTPIGEEAEAVELVAYTAMQCVKLEGKERPSMTDIVSNLERATTMCQGSHGSISSISLGSYD